jgi:hypothetical protein
MSKSQKIVLAIITIALLSVGVSLFLVKTPASWLSTTQSFNVVLAATSALAVTYCGAVVLFARGLKVYKNELKVAYSAISIGIILNALGTLELPIGALGWLPKAVTSSGLAIAPFLLSGLSSYVGVSKLSHLVGVKTPLIQAGLVVPSIIILSTLTIFWPHGRIDLEELYYDVYNAILLWICAFNLLNGLILLKLRSAIGAHYVNTIAWLCLAYLNSALVTGIALGNSMFSYSTDNWLNVALDIAGAAVGLMYVRAGYTFTKTEEL